MLEARSRSNCLRGERQRHRKRFASFFWMTALIVLAGIHAQRAEPSEQKTQWEEIEKAAESMPPNSEEKRRFKGSLERMKEYERRLERDPSVIRPVVSEILSDMKGSDDASFPDYLSEFEHVVRVQGRKGAGIPNEVIDQAAERLLEEYAARQKTRPGWYLSAVDFAIKRSTSPAVRRFIIKGLEKNQWGERDQILNSIYWTPRYRGDQEIYDKIWRLYREKKGEKYRLIGILVRLDRERTFPTLRKLVKKVRTVPDLNKLASILSSVRTPEAMELLLSRVKDFPSAPMESDQSPTGGIYTEPLLDYVRQVEDGQLEIALDVVLRTPARIWSYQVLIDKLKSESPRSRRAVMACLRKLFAAGDFVGDESRDSLRKHLEVETDAGVKAEGQAALDEVSKQLKQRK